MRTVLTQQQAFQEQLQEQELPQELQRGLPVQEFPLPELLLLRQSYTITIMLLMRKSTAPRMPLCVCTSAENIQSHSLRYGRHTHLYNSSTPSKPMQCTRIN